MSHVLPRAARNVESLLPSRPLLHNPYVPASGDPSADLMVSKIAQNGNREAEAELLGGTTGRAGHTGRCAVCVIQRKGKPFIVLHACPWELSRSFHVCIYASCHV